MTYLLIILFIFVGHVMDQDGKPVSYATVYPERMPELGTATGSDGAFRFEADLNDDDIVVVSFIGYEKRLLRAGELQAYALTNEPIRLQEQPIEVEELVVETKRTKIKNKKKQMAYLLHQVMLQLEGDWPKDHAEYHVVSDVRMECAGEPWGMEQMAARIVDSTQFQGLWCKRYFKPEIRQLADSIYHTSTLENMDSKKAKKEGHTMRKMAIAIDSGVVVHKGLWTAGNIYNDFYRDMNDVKNWSVSRENEGQTVLTYTEKHNFLGIFKSEKKSNYILNSEQLSVERFSQQMEIWVNIPFGGYKMNKDQLQLLNMLNMGEKEIEKFRLRKAHAVIKLNTLYQWQDGKIYIREKNLVTDAILEGSKKTAMDIPMQIWATQRVTGLKTKDVKPLTSKEQSKRVVREIVEIY